MRTPTSNLIASPWRHSATKVAASVNAALGGHVISVSNVTLHSRALYAHSGVPPRCARTHTHIHIQTYAHTQASPLPLVFVNIKPQNDYLNMTSACLCVNVWRICYSYRSVREACGDINVCRLTKWGHKYMNNISRTALRLTSSAFDRFIWVKLSSCKGIHGNPSK